MVRHRVFKYPWLTLARRFLHTRRESSCPWPARCRLHSFVCYVRSVYSHRTIFRVRDANFATCGMYSWSPTSWKTFLMHLQVASLYQKNFSMLRATLVTFVVCVPAHSWTSALFACLRGHGSDRKACLVTFVCFIILPFLIFFHHCSWV